MSAPPVDPGDLPDDDLAQAVARGDLEAFDRLLDRYGSRVQRYLTRLTGDPHGAEDLTQEVFMKMFRGVSQRDPSRGFAVWLFRIAHNEAVDQRRRCAARDRAVAVATESTRTELRDGQFVGHSPLEQVQFGEARRALEGALATLPESFRNAFLLREAEGLSYEEIASVLAVSPKTVSTRIHRARQRLKDLLAVHLGQEPAPALRPADGVA